MQLFWLWWCLTDSVLPKSWHFLPCLAFSFYLKRHKRTQLKVVWRICADILKLLPPVLHSWSQLSSISGCSRCDVWYIHLLYLEWRELSVWRGKHKSRWKHNKSLKTHFFFQACKSHILHMKLVNGPTLSTLYVKRCRLLLSWLQHRVNNNHVCPGNVWIFLVLLLTGTNHLIIYWFVKVENRKLHYLKGIIWL